ncbi:hypothetical protein MKFW12EY_22830 [Methylomonas koyamae]|nr:hypothetical protein MKFW12EY_22830 [Methylomonas koyamae]
MAQSSADRTATAGNRVWNFSQSNPLPQPLPDKIAASAYGKEMKLIVALMIAAIAYLALRLIAELAGELAEFAVEAWQHGQTEK